MKIETAVCGPLHTNCYVVSEGNDCIIIDAAGECGTLLGLVGNRKLLAVVQTHGHFDHIGAVDEICNKTGAPLFIHEYDAEMLSDPVKNVSMKFYRRPLLCDTVPNTFTDGETLTFGGIVLRVMLTPGHTLGSCCLYTRDVIFSGDTLFRGTIGRTDHYGGDTEREILSVMQIAMLPGDLEVLPGHGEKTSLSAEREYNPYINKRLKGAE